MRGLCGWFSKGPVNDAGASLQRMLAAHHGLTPNIEAKHLPQGGVAVFGSVARPMLVEIDGFTLATAGHPRLRDGDRAVFDPATLVHRLRERGKAALAGLGGDFALAGWDSRRQSGLLAVDRLGVHQLMYTNTNGSLVFGSTLDMLLGHPGVPRQLSMQSIFDYLYYHVCPGRACR